MEKSLCESAMRSLKMSRLFSHHDSDENSFSGRTAQTDLLKKQPYEAKIQGSEMKNMVLFYIVVTK